MSPTENNQNAAQNKVQRKRIFKI